MKKYLKVLNIFLLASFNKLVAYPPAFFSGLSITLYWAILAIVSITVLTYQAESVGGWNKSELFLVQGIYSLIVGIVFGVFNYNIAMTIEEIWEGKFDFKLLKPIDAQFLSTFGHFRFHNFGRLLLGIILILYALITLQIGVSLWQIILFAALLMSSMLIAYTLVFFVVPIAIWSPHIFNLNDAVGSLLSLSRYPLIIFRVFGDLWIYILLPLVVITSVPAQILIGRPDPALIILSLSTAGGLFVLMRLFWRYSLRHYNSAS